MTDTSAKPDLSGEDFSRRRLNGCNFSRADLSGAHLWRADLRKATFTDADLHLANLSDAFASEANFDGANLKQAFAQRLVAWNTSFVRANLELADLGWATLLDANLTEARCCGTNFTAASAQRCKLVRADLRRARAFRADFTMADLTSANLYSANLNQCGFNGATLASADLRDMELVNCALIDTDLTNSDLTGSRVFGTSVWNVTLQNTKQTALVITCGEPSVEVDSLEMAQFIYLILNNQKIRNVIDTITSKVVLILGRFTTERKAILNAIRDELRKRNYTPVLFDFDKPSNRDITETVSTLAHMARFVIADITDAKSIPQELMAIVPTLPSVPVQPLLLACQQQYGMFEHFKRFPWVLEPFLYEDSDGLLAAIPEHVIRPAEAKTREQKG
jgi:uncharacterized protein YjbI with pentapeptide repeats